MALISCAECGRQISDKAASCPQCGAPVGTAPTPLQAVVKAAAPSPTGQATLPEGAESKPLWTGGPSHWDSLGFYCLMALLSLLSMGVGLIVTLPLTIWRILVIRCTDYTFTNQRLKVMTGVLNRRTEELELFRVVDTSLDQPFILRLFDCGHVQLVTSDSTTPSLILRAVPEPAKVREAIRGLTQEARARRRTLVMEPL